LTPPSWSDSIFLGDTDFQADAGRAREDLSIFHSFSNYQSYFRTHFNSIWGARAEFGDGAINPSTQGSATLFFGKAAKISTALFAKTPQNPESRLRNNVTGGSGSYSFQAHFYKSALLRLTSGLPTTPKKS
jgi:hypothetical protein